LGIDLTICPELPLIVALDNEAQEQSVSSFEVTRDRDKRFLLAVEIGVSLCFTANELTD
jgi:hypothetical protein